MKNRQKTKFKQEAAHQLIGWILFILCAIFFLASGITHGDILTTVGSVIFLLACFVFLIPLIRSNRGRGQ
jgi:predicted membrane channel-forming protein YqfA (hemolysin III family)